MLVPSMVNVTLPVGVAEPAATVAVTLAAVPYVTPAPLSVVVVLAALIVKAYAPEVEPLKLLSPLYVHVSECAPAASVLVL
jgi:hypothetical protein